MRRGTTVEVWVRLTHYMGFICIFQLPCAFRGIHNWGVCGRVPQREESLALHISLTEHCFRACRACIATRNPCDRPLLKHAFTSNQTSLGKQKALRKGRSRIPKHPARFHGQPTHSNLPTNSSGSLLRAWISFEAQSLAISSSNR